MLKQITTLKLLSLFCFFFFTIHSARAADLSLQIDFTDVLDTNVGSTFPSPALYKIFEVSPEFSPLKDLQADLLNKEAPLKMKTIKAKAFFHMTGLAYKDAEKAKSEYNRFRETLERKLLLNLFALSNHPAEILSQKEVADTPSEKTLLLETSLFTTQLEEGTLQIEEESSGLLKSTTSGLETGWQIVGSFSTELKIVTGYLKTPKTQPSR